MAIQIRRGTNTEWESNNSNIVVGEPAIATDAERFFVGTASGDYAEFANIDVIAPAYDTTTSYVVGDIINYHGKLYSCNAPCSGAFNASYWDEKSLAEILKDLENEIDYAQYEIGYADGKLITIDNGASEIPVKDLEVEIKAVQDLHGYDHPWVGGAGKNKLPNHEIGNYTLNGITATYVSNGTITVNGTATAVTVIPISSSNTSTNKLYLPAGTYTISGGNSSEYWVGLFKNSTSGSWYATSGGIIGSDTFIIESGDYVYPAIRIGNGTTVTNLKFYPMIRLSTESAGYEPYENICPISGWDKVNVTRTGKNKFEQMDFPLLQNGITLTKDTNGIITANGTATANTYPTIGNYIGDGSRCIVSGCRGGSASTYRLNLYKGSSVVAQSINGDSIVFVAEKGVTYNLIMYINSGATLNNVKFYPMIRPVDTDATYEPYNGQTYTTDLDGVRYGGTLDVTTGVLTVTHKYVNYDENSFWSQNGSTVVSTNVPGDCRVSQVPLASHAQGYSPRSSVDIPANGCAFNANFLYFNFKFPSDMSVDDWKAILAVNNLQIVYELATPQVVQLTPTQVRTVLGTNNIWNQINSNNELAYRISNALN